MLEREEPAYVIDEIDDLIVFLSLDYHPLVVPKARIPEIFGLDRAATGGQATIPAADGHAARDHRVALSAAAPERFPARTGSWHRPCARGD